MFTSSERRCGLPIGNQTSQLFGNVMLDPLDHHIKETLRRKAYLRYCDDFLVFGNDGAELRSVKWTIEQFVTSLRLQMHPQKFQVLSVRRGVPWLGFRIFPDRCYIRSASLRRSRRRLDKMNRRFAANEITIEQYRSSVMGWMGHVQHHTPDTFLVDVLGHLGKRC